MSKSNLKIELLGILFSYPLNGLRATQNCESML